MAHSLSGACLSPFFFFSSPRPVLFAFLSHELQGSFLCLCNLFPKSTQPHWPILLQLTSPSLIFSPLPPHSKAPTWQQSPHQSLLKPHFLSLPRTPRTQVSAKLGWHLVFYHADLLFSKSPVEETVAGLCYWKGPEPRAALAGSVWALDFTQGRFHNTSPGDFESMFIKAGDMKQGRA